MERMKDTLRSMPRLLVGTRFPMRTWRRLRGVGWLALRNTINGAQAEYLRVPYAQANLAKIPDELTDEQVVLLADILAACYLQVLHVSRLSYVALIVSKPSTGGGLSQASEN